MNPKSAIQKGKLLENHIVDLLNEYGIDKNATRQVGSGNGKKKGDIHTNIGWTIEAKNTKNFNFKEATEQVKRESMGYQKELIVWHKNGTPLDNSIAILNIRDFMELLQKSKNNEGRETILDKYQIRSSLEKAVFHLKQVVKEI